jgi:2-phospho-L-lactate transferase/gluconeogenesis factor (CofD/UPF0052 family)
LQRLNALAELLPGDFNLRGASLGNLALAADCLTAHTRADTGETLSEAMRCFAALFQARGRLEPASREFAHLGVELASGRVLLGQHRFTGLKPGRSKAGAGGSAREKILRLFYCAGLEDPTRLRPACGPRVQALIREADLLCYPPGSFFSSILANVQLKGVGRTAAESRALKLYMPNPGPDPESAGLSLEERLEFLTEALLQDAPGAVPGDVLNCLLVDAAHADYPGGVPTSWCRKRGVRIIDYPFTLKARGSGGFIPADPLRSALLLHLLAEAGRDGRGGGGSYV